MSINLYDIIQTELQQRNVNTVVCSILLDLCKKHIIDGQESYVLESTPMQQPKSVERPDIEGRSELYDPPQREVEQDKTKDVSKRIEKLESENVKNQNLDVSEENLDMFSKMMG